MEAQCWICPYCFDDHGLRDECGEKDLKERIDKLVAERDRYREALEIVNGSVSVRDTWWTIQERAVLLVKGLIGRKRT